MIAFVVRLRPRGFWGTFGAAALALAGVAALAPGADSQELEPRAYVNTPVGMNFLLTGYGYSKGSVVLSPSSPIKDASVETHAALLGYVRSLDVFGLSGKVGALLAGASASGQATVAGQVHDRELGGLADPRFWVTVNLYGAPALSLEQFAEFEQELIVGVKLEVSPALGQYDSDKLLNIGTNRWSIKSEVGLAKALEAFTLEMSAAVTFFTDNSDFLGGKTLELSPIYSVQGHLAYELRPGFWAALDATYYTGGRSTIDGDRGEPLEHVRLGLTLALPITRHHSVKLFGSTGLYSRTGSDFWALGIAWQVRWGGGL